MFNFLFSSGSEGNYEKTKAYAVHLMKSFYQSITEVYSCNGVSLRKLFLELRIPTVTAVHLPTFAKIRNKEY